MLGKAEYQYIVQRLQDKERPFLRPRGFPAKAFDIETLPYQLSLGNGETRVVYPRALSFTREWGEKTWVEKTNALTKEERRDCQIVIIPPRHTKNGNGDFSISLHRELQEDNLGSRHPVILFNRTRYEEHEYGKNIGMDVGQQKAVKSVYIVASGVTEEDLSDIRAVAKEYKDAGAIEVNLIAPFIKDEREDKNIGKSRDDKEGTYNGRIIKIKNVMEAFSSAGIDRIVTFEPHSSATQSFAIINGMALAPISLEEELIGEIKDKIRVDPNNWVVVRPDAGRNLVATRIERLFNLPGVHLEKLRNSATRQSETTSLSEAEAMALKGKNTILYDDEGGTLGTIRDIVLSKFIPAGVSSINIFLAHARLQKKWRKNLDEIIRNAKKKNIPINIYFSDSRRPLGNLKLALRDYSKIIKVIPIKEKVKKTIMACIQGVNFWVNNGNQGVNWERSILQAVPWFDSDDYWDKIAGLSASN
ncbi:MAG: hypothetical protein ACOYUB_05055 [Patescibacteria group bacterium]